MMASLFDMDLKERTPPPSQLEERPPPPSKTPKNLADQAAVRIASQVVENCLPALIQYLLDPDDSVRYSLVVYLKKLKRQYWDANCGLMEPFRRYVSAAIIDVMELQSLKTEALSPMLIDLMNNQKETSAPFLLVTFTAQVLFTYEAGCSSTMDLFKCFAIRSRTSNIFSQLLGAVAPFSLEKLSTEFIKFDNPLPLLLMLRGSPRLKHVYLFNNACTSVFRSLRMHCRNLETIYAKLISYYIVYTREVKLEDFLFETFFEGMGMEAVVRSVDSDIQPRRSFPNLKEVTINNYSVNTCVPVNDIMYCLQHFYPNVRTKWFTYINVNKPVAKLCTSSFQLQSPFTEKGKYKWDVAEIGFVNNMEILSDNSYQFEEYPTINHVVVEVDAELGTDFKSFIENVMKRHQSKSIELVLYKQSLNNNPEIVSIFNEIGKTLQTLHLTLPSGLLVKGLAAALNSCCSLKVLSIEANNLEYKYVPETPFREFSELKSLTVDVHTQSNEIVATQALVMHLLAAAPCIKTLKLSNISHETLESMISSGSLSQLRTFEIGSPFPKNLEDFIKRLPALSVLIVNYEHYLFNKNKGHIYDTLKNIFHWTSLNIIGIGRSSRFPLKKCHEFC